MALNLHELKNTFLITSRSVLLKTRKDPDKSRRENPYTHFVFKFFFLIKKYGSQRHHRHQQGACALHAGKLRIQTRNQNMYYLMLFHCYNGYAKAPQCYVYNYIYSLVNNDVVQFELLIIQFNSPVKRQVANYNNNNNKNNNNNNSKTFMGLLGPA